MAHFVYIPEPSPLLVQRHGKVHIADDWTFSQPGQWSVTVPMGFETDGASVPRIFAPLISAWDLSFSAPVAHDLLYRTGGAPHQTTKTFTRRETDLIFRMLQEDEGVWWWRRWASWLAVRAFGFLAWRRGNSRPEAF